MTKATRCDRRIILIGFSAVGKSTAARGLAERLGWTSLDTDREVMARSGKTIRQILHGEGEEAFRRYERQILNDASRKQGVIVGAGAGAVLVESARQAMQRSFFIVCLEARPEALHARLLKDRETGVNPVAELLTGGDDPVGHIAYLKQFRQPYYAIAHWTVHTDWLTPEEVVDEVVRGWQYYCRADAPGRVQHPPDALRYPLGDARESDCPYDPKVWQA